MRIKEGIIVAAIILTAIIAGRILYMSAQVSPMHFATTEELISTALANKEAVGKIEVLKKMVNCSSIISEPECNKLFHRLAQEKDIVSALTKIHNKDIFIWVSQTHPNKVDEDGWVILNYKSSAEDIKKFLGIPPGSQK